MNLLEEIAAASAPIQECKMGRWLTEQTPEYQAEIREALASDFASNTIWRVLTAKHGVVVSASVFVKHRERRCCCVVQR